MVVEAAVEAFSPEELVARRLMAAWMNSRCLWLPSVQFPPVWRYLWTYSCASTGAEAGSQPAVEARLGSQAVVQPDG